MRVLCLTVSLLAVGLSGSGLLQAQSVIADADFNPANWSQAFSLTAPNGSTASFSQLPSGGNPGSCLRVDYSLLGPGTFYEITYFSAQSYTPSAQGRIQSLSFSADIKNLSSTLWGTTRFALKQGSGIYFRLGSGFTTSGSSWSRLTANALSATDFSEANNGTRPDLINGGPIQFGLFTGYTAGGGPLGSTAYGIDNFQVTITAVPEPRLSWLAGLCSGLGLAVGLRWRRGLAPRQN